MAVAPALGRWATSSSLKRLTAESRSSPSVVLSPMLMAYKTGFCERNMKPLMSFFSSLVISSSRSGCSFSSDSFERISSACSRSNSPVRPFFRSFSTRSRRFSTWVRSLIMRSNSTFLMSRRGSMGPTWGMESSSKARSTWISASTLRRLVRNAVSLRASCPMAATSTYSTEA